MGFSAKITHSNIVNMHCTHTGKMEKAFYWIVQDFSNEVFEKSLDKSYQMRN